MKKSPLPEVLPPVEPPNARFLLQLFVIPLVIVGIIVAVWLAFYWVAHIGTDPKSLIMDLKRLNQASWQKAMSLADLLRNPEHDAIKDNETIAADLASFLEQQIRDGSLEKNSVKMRMFLCRALGEFRTPIVTEALCLAISTDRDGDKVDGIEINVRLSAMEAIALLAGNVGSETLRQNPKVVAALIAASQERGNETDSSKRQFNRSAEDAGNSLDKLDLQTPRSELRAVAAFALGVIGGKEGLDRLDYIAQNDPYTNARFNAATGLARHGDPRSIPTLADMMDLNNEESVRDETGEAERNWKRVLVANNAIRAARQLFLKNSAISTNELSNALEKLLGSNLRGVSSKEAAELLDDLKNSTK